MHKNNESTIILLFHGPRGSKITEYEIGINEPFWPSMNCYAAKIDQKMSELRFESFGRKVREHDTPNLLGLKDDDEIDVFLEAKLHKKLEEIQKMANEGEENGGSKKEGESKKSRIWLRFLGNNSVWGEFREQSIPVRNEAPFGIAKQKYATRIRQLASNLRFLGPEGNLIDDEQSAVDLNLEADDMIQVFPKGKIEGKM